MVIFGSLLPLQACWLVVVAAGAACLRYQLPTHPRVAASVIAVIVSTFIDTMTSEPPIGGDFWSHVFPGIFLLIGGRMVSTSDGRQRLPRVAAVAFGSAAMLAIVVHTRNMLASHPGFRGMPLLHLIHYFIFATILCLVVAAGLTHGSRRGSYGGGAIVGPMAFVALGIILTVHLHDPRPVPRRFHIGLGYALTFTGGMQMAHTVAHAQLGGRLPLTCFLRQLHCFAWIFTGAWLLTMALILYTRDAHGSYLLGTEEIAAAPEAKAGELVWSLFALSMLLPAGVVALLDGRAMAEMAELENGAQPVLSVYLGEAWGDGADKSSTSCHQSCARTGGSRVVHLPTEELENLREGAAGDDDC